MHFSKLLTLTAFAAATVASVIPCMEPDFLARRDQLLADKEKYDTRDQLLADKEKYDKCDQLLADKEKYDKRDQFLADKEKYD
ncbi:hypothetical protein BP6252_09313 [Coleophoma cylindrospora]|uniref:Uncharacterized protein n=1 Tax=Coleophoma cylindrospora TaxID=1849047 RepID=A0A3D8R1K6_9HELO|nr:hypothetical protein BP6252_09313 [Coleophoma cylindrospora]